MKTAASFGMLFLLFSLQISFSQINWQQTNGPYGGIVNCFAVSGTNLFAGTNGSGAFLSTNNGTSWIPVNAGLTSTYVWSFVFSGTNLFAATGNGVFLTTNNGATWSSASNGLASNHIWTLAVSGTNLFAGTLGEGVFLSTDNGTSWTPVNSGLTSKTVWSFAVKGTNLFAGTNGGGVFLSTNNGTSWTAMNAGLTMNNSSVTVNDVVAFAVDGTNLFAGTNSGVFLSTNNGTSWVAVNNGLTDFDISSFAVIPNGTGGTNLFGGGSDGGVFLSTNNGASWTDVNSGLMNTSIKALAVIGTNLFAGTNGSGIFLSMNNGTNWSAASTGLAITWIHSLAVSGTNIFAGNYNGGGVFLTTNNGISWTTVRTGLPNGQIMSLAAYPNAAGGTNLFAGVYMSGVYLSTNNGTSWTAASTGLPTINVDVSDFALNGANLFAGAWGDGVFLSTNNGTSWTAVNTGLTNKNVKALVLSGTNLFAGTDSGGVFLSTNNGTSWNAVNTGLTNTDVYALAVSPNGAGGSNIFAGTIGGGAFLSTNNGTSWTAANTGLTYLGVQTFAVIGTYILAGTDAGVFLSTNNGTSWTAANTGLTNPYIFALAVSPAADGTSAKFFAGADGGGVYVGSILLSPPSIISCSPTRNALNAAKNTNITLSFDQDINQSTLTNSTIKIFGSLSGVHTSTFGYNSSSQTAIMTPTAQFKVGEVVTVTATRGIKNVRGDSLQKSYSWSFTIKVNTASGIFMQTSTSGIGVNPYSITAGDWNGDGFLDLAVKNMDYTVSILMNNGSNQFTKTSSLTIGTINAPGSITAGDWNGDGYVDLAATDEGSSTASILMNNGSGQFTISTTINTGDSPSSIISRDWNGDGYPDLAIANYGSSTVSILINTGNGQFRLSSTISVGNNPISIIAGDWNGDGAQDLAVSNFGSNTISILLNNGIGQFTQTSVLAVGTNPCCITAGDWNGDGYQDLAVAICTNNTISILTNNGNGQFTQTSSPVVGNYPVSVVSGDWNGDGYLDLAVANGRSSTVSILINNGRGQFTNTSAVSVGSYPESIVSGDWNGNGDLDLAVTNSNSSTVSILMNGANSNITPPTITSFTPISGPTGTSVTIGGTNFSPTPTNNIVYFGAVRATVTGATSTSLNVIVPTGATYKPISVTVNGLTAYSNAPFNVTFAGGGSIKSSSFVSKIDFTTGSDPQGIVICDVDGDGKSDVIVVNGGDKTVSVYRNTSASGSITTSSFAPKADFTTGSWPNSVAVQDVDGDGKPDLVVTNYSSNTVSIFRNSSTSGSITASSFAPKIDFTTGSEPISVAIGDVDGDGKPDLIVANFSGNTVSVLRNTSTSGSITASSFAAKVDFTTGTYPKSIAINDVDGDGKPDLIVANFSGNTVSVLKNTSTPGSITASSFAPKIDFITGSEPICVAIGDVDGDGKPDLVVTNGNSNTVSVLRNTSTYGSITASSFAAKVDFATGSVPEDIAIADLDGDGKPDLVTNGRDNTTSQFLSVFKNTSMPGIITASSFAPKVDFMTGSFPQGVAVGDLDGDGNPDLVVTNYDSNTFSVLRNNMITNTAPAAPQNLTAIAGNGQVTLRWNKNTEADFLRYRIYRSTSPNPTTKIDSTTGGINDTTKIITGLTNGTTYYFRITAVNSAGLESVYSNEVSIKPTNQPAVKLAIPDLTAPAAGATVFVPMNVTKFTNVGAITLEIDYNQSVVKFVGIANAFSGMSFTVGANTPGAIKLIWYDVTAATPINIDTGKLVDLKFTYVGGSCPLTFNTAQCEVANENVVPITGITYQNGSIVAVTPPAAPQNLIAVVGNNQVTLKWNKNTEPDFLRYRIYRSTSPNPTIKVDSTTGGIADTAKVITGLTNSTTYYFRITAVDSAGSESEFSNEVSTTGNQKPVFTAILPITKTALDTVKFVVNATDPNAGDVLMYSAAGLPTGAKFDSTRTFFWIPTVAQYGTYKVNFLVSDGQLKDSMAVSIAVTMLNLCLKNPISDMTLTDAQRAVKVKLTSPPVFANNTGVLTYTTASANTFYVTASIIAPDTLKVQGLRPTPPDVGIRIRVTANDTNQSTISTTFFVVDQGTTGVIDNTTIPKEFSLSQNYPNPFNPSTNIDFNIPARSFVLLRVFDIMGRDVATLINQEMSAGTYQVTFDASQLPGGVYFYRLQAGTFTGTKKLLLLK
jgi:fibronectin type 3 domain-containing protein